MAQRWRSRARRDPDVEDDDVGGGSPPSRRPRRGGSGDEEEDDDDVGNEDLSLEIVARARRRRHGASGGGTPGLADLLQVSSGDEEAGEDAVVELGEAEEPRRKQRKKQRKRQRKKHRKEEAEAAAAPATAAPGEEQKEVGGTQQGPIGTAESVLTEDGADVPASDNMVLRKLLVSFLAIMKMYLLMLCGEIGHDMFGCTNDYPPDDIKNGHLCCFDVADNCPKQISCYNCAKSGHSGLFHRSKGKSSSHSQRKEKWKKDSSARSAPHDARKTSKRKSPHFEDRMDIPRHKSKARGGWTGGDDLDDLPFKKYKSNGWGSPSTPKKPYMNRQISDGDYFTPQSSRRHNHDYTSPNSNYSPSAKKHGFSLSRFAASNTHVRFGRS
ncbi:zinc finger CCHC domain-containing protein 7-like [Panicum miliaceum]|uniref:Zinc finger CCHC domain-containing protein 7-like n=1 Tax=Panicum miliaceum TaxID=4540 RepID=A0A3L6PHV4_PANMI|nr:zinc finger CCHC domain-containing protein 7-like [Panicum miliaceum]